jgi:hypothetical protein
VESVLLVVVLVAGVVLALVGGGWAVAWALVRRAAIDAQLKQDMLARGLSVEEMERLLQRSAIPSMLARPAMVLPRSVEEVQPLLEHGMSVEDIEYVLSVNPPLSVEEIEPLLEQGLSAQDIARLLRPPLRPVAPAAHADERAIQEMATCLRRSGIAESVIEQVFSVVRVAEPPIKQALCQAIRGLAGDSGDAATDKDILAVLRGLTGDGKPPREGTPSPAGEANTNIQEKRT